MMIDSTGGRLDFRDIYIEFVAGLNPIESN
jgi:hypothetical protein